MQKKLLRYNVLSTGLIIGALLIAGVTYAASAKDMRFFLQANDGGCTSQLGYSQHTDFVNKTTGLGFARWVTDGNGYDPDCYRVNLEVATPAPAADMNKDFRACLQFADYVSIDSRGQVTGLNGAGAQQCTPWASEGGGSSAWATDSNKYDPDGAHLEIETRALPAGTVITDVRLGMQMSDGGCTKQAGTIRFTPWASAGGGWSSFAADSNAYDPDCGKVYLETKVTNGTCTEPIADSQQPKVLQQTMSVISMDGTGTGWKDCSSDSVLTNLRLDNGGSDRKEWSGTCTDTENLVDPNSTIVAQGTTIVAPRVVYPTGDDAYCTQGSEVMVGALYYDDDANGSKDEGIRAIHCRKMLPGMTLDYNNIQVFANAGCGQNECNSTSAVYGSLRTAKDAKGQPFVPIGMNIRPNDSHKYARGIWAAPVKKLEPKIITCPTTPPTPPAPTGDLMVARYGGPFGLTTPPLSFGSPIQGTEAWIDSATPAAANKQSTNPAMFYQLSAPSQHTIYVTDLPNKKEIVSFASCARGSTSCAPWHAYTTLAASSCNGTYCAIPATVPVTADTVLRVAVGYLDETVTVVPPPASTTNPNPNPIPPVATCTLTATPATIVLNVGSSKLEWNCTGSATVVISDNNEAFANIGTKSASGSVNVSPDKTTVFTVTAGSATDSATVTVGGSNLDENGGI